MYIERAFNKQTLCSSSAFTYHLLIYVAFIAKYGDGRRYLCWDVQGLVCEFVVLARDCISTVAGQPGRCVPRRSLAHCTCTNPNCHKRDSILHRPQPCSISLARSPVRKGRTLITTPPPTESGRTASKFFEESKNYRNFSPRLRHSAKLSSQPAVITRPGLIFKTISLFIFHSGRCILWRWPYPFVPGGFWFFYSPSIAWIDRVLGEFCFSSV